MEGPPKLARNMWKRFALAAVAIVCLSAATTSTAVLLEVDTVAGYFERESAPIPEIEGALDDVDAGDPQTILLLGSDRRYADIASKAPTRSDTMILVRLDPSKGATALMSLPRDLKVRIPGHGTDKLNASYAIGKERLVVRTIRQMLAEASPTGSFPIHHVVNVNFGGFRRAVNRLGCVYVDVDRRYFNDNNPPFGGGPNYATIDVQAGYQLMCGQDALDYVRYRHFDSDIVRAARQQEFLRQAKEQVGVSKIFSDRKELLRIFARYTQTDIRGTDAILRLLKLAVESAQNPVQEVRFPGEVTGDFVEVSDAGLQRAVSRFLDARATPGRRGQERKSSEDRTPSRRTRRRAREAGLPPGMILNRNPNEDVAVRLATKGDVPVYFPKAQLSSATLQNDDTRAYRIVDRRRKRYDSYRFVFRTNEIGQYYGVQGTTWMSPPILDNPSERRTMGGRQYELFFDGDRLRLVAWRTSKGVYWVSNSLLQTLTNRQMLALARSLTRIGAK